MSDALEEDERMCSHWRNVGEGRKILEHLEDSVEDNKKNFKHQYLGEPFEKGGLGADREEQTIKMFEEMSDVDQIMALFMECCGLVRF